MRKNFQYFFLFIHTFVNKHKKHLLLGILSGFLTTLFLIQAFPLLYSQFFGQKNIKIAIVGEYSEDNLPLFILNQISSGLTAVNAKQEAIPSLAKSWEVDEKGLNYTFHIDPDVYWQDGTKFKVQDVNFKLKGATFSSPDQNTLKINLKEPYSPLPVLLSKPVLKSPLIGVGKYKMVKIQYNGDILSGVTLSPTVSGYPTLIYKIYSTASDALLAFKMGEINVLYQIPDVSELAKWKNIRITETTQYDRYLCVFYNLRDRLFKEKEVRQALTYAIPKFESKEVVSTPISPLSWAYSNKVRIYKYDPEIAQKILSKTEISSPSSAHTITTFSSLLPIAQSVADSWNKVGVKAKVKVTNSIPSDYQILLLTQTIPVDPDQYQYWQSTQENTNLSHYNNLKIDKLLEDGRKTSDPDKRIKIYADFQRYLVDDAPVTFLYYPKVYTVEKL